MKTEFTAMAQGRTDYLVEVGRLPHPEYGDLMTICASEEAIYITKAQAMAFWLGRADHSRGANMIDPDLIDDDGENRAVRAFLMLYGNNTITAKAMKEHMIASGFPHFPAWVEESPGHLTKGGAQVWLRMLFDLEKEQA